MRRFRRKVLNNAGLVRLGFLHAKRMCPSKHKSELEKVEYAVNSFQENIYNLLSTTVFFSFISVDFRAFLPFTLVPLCCMGITWLKTPTKGDVCDLIDKVRNSRVNRPIRYREIVVDDSSRPSKCED